MGPHKEDNDPARLVELVVVGEWENGVDDALAIIGKVILVELAGREMGWTVP